MMIDDDLRRELLDGAEDIMEVFNRVKTVQTVDEAMEVYEEVKGILEETLESLNDLKLQEDVSNISEEE